MDNFRILHLSDFHYSKDKEKDISIVIKALFDDLKIFKTENIIPNIIAFSGDLVISGERKDFEKANSLLFDRILDFFNLTYDNLVICPGNHDIQRDKIDDIFESGLCHELTNRQSVNTVIDKYKEGHSIFDRLSSFESFFKTINNCNIVSHTPYYSVYIYHYENIDIGWLCINSSWRAYGGNEDYGHLLIGERALIQGLEFISGCQIKIGLIHHPFEWLEEFERLELRRIILSSFDFLLTGHNHMSDASLVQLFNDSQILMLSGGALYQSRDFHNGYSLLQINGTNKTGLVNLREFDPTSRKFLPEIRYFENGQFPFELVNRKYLIGKKDLSVFSILHENILLFTSSILLRTSNTKFSGKNLQDVFVKPPLFIESENKLKTILSENAVDNYEITLDLLSDVEENLLIIGGKESGKTTLLYYLMTKLGCPENLDLVKYPLYINFYNIPQGSNRIEKAISEFLLEIKINVNCSTILERNNWVLFIDDLNYEDKKSVIAINELMKKYPNGRYIFALNEDLLSEIENENSPILDENFKRVYIHSFRRKEIRTLVGKLSQEIDEEHSGEIADAIIRKMSDIHLPLTPMIISMMFISIEKDKNFIPINKSSLIENIFEIILPKAEIQDVFRGKLDISIINDFLSNTAILMNQNSSNKISQTEFESFASRYFFERGLIVSEGINSLISFLISKGLLWYSNELYSFKFRGFLEYFIAKYMVSDIINKGDFFQNILDTETYLEYIGPLDYLSGMLRHNLSLLIYIKKQIGKHIQNIKEKNQIEAYDIDLFEEFGLDLDQTDESQKNEKTAVEEIRASKMSEEEKDQLSEKVNKMQSTESKEEFQKIKYVSLESKLLGSLLLYATIIKHSELIESKEIKKEHLLYCINSYILTIYVIIKSFDDNIDKMNKEQVEEWIAQRDIKSKIDTSTLEGLKNIAKYFDHNFIFSLFQLILCSQIETPQLMIILQDSIKENSNILIEIVLIKIYADMRLPGFVDYMYS